MRQFLQQIWFCDAGIIQKKIRLFIAEFSDRFKEERHKRFTTFKPNRIANCASGSMFFTWDQQGHDFVAGSIMHLIPTDQARDGQTDPCKKRATSCVTTHCNCWSTMMRTCWGPSPILHHWHANWGFFKIFYFYYFLQHHKFELSWLWSFATRARRWSSWRKTWQQKRAWIGIFWAKSMRRSILGRIWQFDFNQLFE